MNPRPWVASGPSGDNAAEYDAHAAAGALAAGRLFSPRVSTPVRVARQDEDAEPAPPTAGAPPAPEPAAGAEPATPGPMAAPGLEADVARIRQEQLDFARDRIAASTRSIGARLAELRTKPRAERLPLQSKVHALERQLADALADRARLLQQRIPELERRLAAGEGVKADLESSRRELTEHQDDLARLGGVFAPETGAAFEETYRTKVAGLHCMQAAYAGLATLRTPAESAEIQRQVESKAEHSKKLKGPNLNQFITVMDTANAEKLAGPKQRARWSRKHKTWSPPLESIVRARVHPAVPGFYFFGLAPAEAIHSVLLGVSTWEEPARMLWCDQFGCALVAGTLDAHALAALKNLERWGVLTYSDWDTYVWQVEPPPAAGLLARPEEAK